MNKIWHLGTCNTCQRIIKELGDITDFQLVDIKKEGVKREDLDMLKELSGLEYVDFFSRRAMKYRSMGLHERTLSQEEMAELITSEYTFLKRPVILIGENVFVGNAKKTVSAAIAANQ